MKHYQYNPRQISKKEIAQLKKDLEELGDLGGVVHDLTTDEIIGGNQRSEAIEEIISGKLKPLITKEYKPKNKQGTVKVGFFEWRGEQFKYRAVRWDDKTRRRANIRANKAGGDWNWDLLASWDTAELIEWGMDKDWLRALNNDANNVREMFQSRVDIDNINEMLEGMPEYKSEDKSSFRRLIVHFMNQKDVDSFSKLIKQVITDKTISINIPERERETSGKYI